MQVDYDDILRVWREADAIPEIEHAWLFDHLMPIGGDPNGPIFEGWTLLSALAAQTRRLRLGLLVTSNRFRPPAMLAKIATTVDIVSGGRLDFGIGVGSRPSHPLARREYAAHGLPFTTRRRRGEPRRSVHRDPAAVDRGRAVRLRRRATSISPERSATPSPSSAPIRRSSSAGARPRRCGWSPSTPTSGTSRAATSTTSSAASALLDRYCAEIGRDPAAITRSIHLPVSYDEPGSTREGDRRGARRRLPAHRPGPARALPRRRRPVGRRRAHRPVGAPPTSSAGHRVLREQPSCRSNHRWPGVHRLATGGTALPVCVCGQQLDL